MAGPNRLTPVVCILHGDPHLPDWLFHPSVVVRLHLVVNDPGPGRYERLPPAAVVHVNERSEGFAANVNAALTRLFAEEGIDLVICTNFDLDMNPAALERLEDAACKTGVGLAGLQLSDGTGRRVFSVGGPPTPLKEFTRAAGLRSGTPQRLVRAVLRRLPAWQLRNAVIPGGERALAPAEYLPWTCVAVQRRAWTEVGPLDAGFAMYAEDLDWGLRASRAGWERMLVEGGPVAHAERLTAGARTNAMYEASHLLLHAKHGWERNLKWQRWGLRVRRYLPGTAPMDWDYLEAARGADTACT